MNHRQKWAKQALAVAAAGVFALVSGATWAQTASPAATPKSPDAGTKAKPATAAPPAKATAAPTTPAAPPAKATAAPTAPAAPPAKAAPGASSAASTDRPVAGKPEAGTVLAPSGPGVANPAPEKKSGAAPPAAPLPGMRVTDPAKKPADTAAAASEVEAYGEEMAGVEVVVVTGSRIGRKNTDSYGNVAVVTAEDLQGSGITTVNDLLDELPSVSLQGLNRNQNNGGNGLAFVDLRNLGSSRSLVLLNGRRMVSGSSGTTDAVDLNSIPVTMVERVEILLDGASATYGSDAIGGVVNIILKDDFDGGEVRLQTGISQYGDGEQLNLSTTVGHNFDRGNLVLNLSWSQRGAIRQQDRAWARNPVTDWYVDPDTGVTEYYYGSYITPNGLAVVGPPGPSQVAYTFVPDGTSSFQEMSDPLAYEYAKDQYLTSALQLFNVFGAASYRLGGGAKAYFEGLFVNRGSAQQLSGQPLHAGNDAYPNPFLRIPFTNPYIPADFLAEAQAAGDTEVLLNRRMNDVGFRKYVQNAQTFRILSGLTGELSKDYKWDLSLNLGRSRQQNEIRNSVNLARVFETLDPATCAANANRGCVVGNYFSPTLQPEVLDYIRFTDTELVGFDLAMLEGSVSGPLFELPGGMAKFAAGADVRREYGFNQPSPLTISRDSAGNGQDPTAGGFAARAAFAEVSLPVLAEKTGVHELTVDLAGRFSNYTTFGSDFTYRLGLAYAPVSDIKLRTNFSTAFRAPGISDLYGGAADSFERVSDPCDHWDDPGVDPVVAANCQAGGGDLAPVPAGFDQATIGGTQIRTNVGGNPALDAESAKVFNIGTVIQPTAVKGLTLTADYYNVTVDQPIESVSPQTIMDQCYASPGLTSPFCDWVTRTSAGSVNRIESTLQNLGRLRTSGVDLTVAYELPLASLGAATPAVLGLGWQGNYMFNFDVTTFGQTERYGGTIDEFSGSYMHLRWNLQARYMMERWSVAALLRYIGGAERFPYRNRATGEIDPTEPYPNIAPTYYVDLAATIKFEAVDLVVGIENLFNRNPPFTMDSGQNSNASTYDFTGRFFFAQLAYRY